MRILSPADYGLPAKFAKWREGQPEFIQDILQCRKRFSVHNAAVGCGKSIVYIAAAIASGKRVVILTESRGLQDQINEDFASVGVFDMRGLQNYTCKALDTGGDLERMWTKRHHGRPTCDIGPCTSGLKCDLEDDGCYYFDAYRKACASKIIVTNYAYWIAINQYGQGLGKFDWLVMDECHAALGCLSSALSVEFLPKDFKALGSRPLKATADILQWQMWGRVHAKRVSGELEFFTKGASIGATSHPDGTLILLRDTDLPDAEELRYWKRMEARCNMLGKTASRDWIVEHDDVTGAVRMAPSWVHQYTESYLFYGIPRVIMLSGTVRPKTADLLGVPSSEREFKEYPSLFPVERRPIYWLPTVKLNHKSTSEDLRNWVVRIDQIIARRQDRKGIVHTRSFAQQRYLMDNSRFRHIMHANASKTTKEVVRKFREAKAPAILVSPSVGTGFDFAYDLARYQIISKLPFYDHRKGILKRQVQDDPDYLNYLTAQELTQQYGRTNRAESDFSESIIVDDNIEWFMQRHSQFFPQYFLDAFQRIDSVPTPPSLESIS